MVERELAIQKDLEIVNVLPTLHAGGSGQLAAFKYMKDPVEVEFITAQAGVDIGDTAIGMHIKHVKFRLDLACVRLVRPMSLLLLADQN